MVLPLSLGLRVVLEPYLVSCTSEDNSRGSQPGEGLTVTVGGTMVLVTVASLVSVTTLVMVVASRVTTTVGVLK